MALQFPDIDPVAFSIGPIDIRWYALAYITGFVVGMWVIKRGLKRYPSPYLNNDLIDDLLIWVMVGVVLGGRLGYVLFYNLGHYIENPVDALKIWHGGMAFHGGLIGVITAMILFARKHHMPFFALSDHVALVTPIGLFFGRIANFINGELYGRPTDAPWGMIFVEGDVARHPSQLYESASEGLLLFCILLTLNRFSFVRDRYGIVSGAFLAGYGIMRFFIEYTRQPDAQLGLLTWGFSMGQLLCLPMVIACGCIIAYALRNGKKQAA